jgi:hypothetical protein
VNPENSVPPRRCLPAAGDYIVDVIGISPEPFRLDLSTRLVQDPKANDPTPAPDIAVEGDTTQWPAAKHTFNVRWNGVTGPEPLRGVIAWVDDADPQREHRLGTTVVDTGPKRAPARPLT